MDRQSGSYFTFLVPACIYINPIWLHYPWNLSGVHICNFVAGGEDGRPSGWSSADPSRRRTTVPALNLGSLKQKSPVANDSTMAKDSLVSIDCNQICINSDSLCICIPWAWMMIITVEYLIFDIQFWFCLLNTISSCLDMYAYAVS